MADIGRTTGSKGRSYKRNIVEPPTHTIERERVQLTESEEAYQFYRISGRTISATRTKGGSNLKKGMAAYATKYGSSELAEQIEKMDSNRIQWMYEQGIIVPEQYFSYTAAMFDEYGIQYDDNTGTSIDSIQFYTEEYNRLYQAGLAERRARRRARGWT